MSIQKITRGRGRLHHRLPFGVQLLELAVGLVVFGAAQNMWAILAGADPDITPPSVPSGLSLSGRTASEIDISWTASTDDTAVTGYHVYRNGVQVGAPTATSFDDTSLTPNTAYSYTVSAFDAATNESAQSTALPVSTLADTSAPSVPANLHQTGQTTSTISIAWNASADNVGVTGYNIYRNGSLIKTQTGTTFTDTGLAVFTGYIYTITAFDGSNNSSNLSSGLIGSTAQDTAPPSVPDNIQETASDVSTLSLSWNASTDNVGVTGYHIYRNGVLVGSPGGTTFDDSGLNVGSSYTYTITAYDGVGNTSAASAPFSASSSTDTTPPSTPINLQTTQILDTSVSISWNASTDNVGVTGYKIYRDSSLVGTSATTSFTDSGLSPVTGYSYTVKAYDAANNTSSASAALPVTTAYDTTAPSVPANLHSTGQTDQSITLAWNASTDNVGVSGYDLYRNGSLITTTSGTSYTDSGRSVSASYGYTIRAHDASGNNSSLTAPFVISTLPDTTPPATPANLVSPSQTTTSINLSWDAASDDVAVVSYNIYRGGTFVANVPGTTYNDPSLHYNTSYSYAVKALDAGGNESAASNTVSVSTLPDTSAPTVSLTTPTDNQSVQLTFLIGATASDDLDLNRVEFSVDGTLISTITSAPFSFNWNSYAVHNGNHSLSVKAIDASGNFSSQTITINVTNPPPPLTADINGDHKVNLFDLSTLLAHWNKAGSGDFNNNGRVDIFDLSVLLSHYGQDDSNYH